MTAGKSNKFPTKITTLKYVAAQLPQNGHFSPDNINLQVVILETTTRTEQGDKMLHLAYRRY